MVRGIVSKLVSIVLLTIYIVTFTWKIVWCYLCKRI